MLLTSTSLAVLALIGSASSALADKVSLFCSASGTEYQLCSDAANAWAKETGNEVQINKMPASWDEALPLYQQLLAAKSPDIDVMLLDVVWVGMLKDQLLDLNTVVPKDEIAAHFPSTVAAGSVDGKLVAMPWYADTGLMFYRKDLLEKYKLPVPKTWAEMATTGPSWTASARQAMLICGAMSGRANPMRGLAAMQSNGWHRRVAARL